MIRKVTLRERLLASTSDLLILQQRMVKAIADNNAEAIEEVLLEMKNKVWSMECVIESELKHWQR